MSETYPKTVSDWTSSDGKRWVLQRQGPSTLHLFTPDDVALASRALMQRVESCELEIAALESALSSAQAERDAAIKERVEAQTGLKMAGTYAGIPIVEDPSLRPGEMRGMPGQLPSQWASQPAPAPASVPGLPTVDEMCEAWSAGHQDEKNGHAMARVRNLVLSRLCGSRPSVEDVEREIKARTNYSGGPAQDPHYVAEHICSMFPAVERQDGGRPSREAVAKAIHRASVRHDEHPFEGWGCNCHLAADAAIALLTPPLPARSSEETVSDIGLAEALCDAYNGEAGTYQDFTASMRRRWDEVARKALFLLPARSSADGEALDRLGAAWHAYIEAGRRGSLDNADVLIAAVQQELLRRGRLGETERSA